MYHILPIPEFPDYLVSTVGEILSLKRKVPHIKKPPITGHGYLQVALYHDGGHKNLLVHRLVAEAFIPNPQNLNTVDHIDNDKLNNHVENLRWMDRDENTYRRRKNNLPMGVQQRGIGYSAHRVINTVRYISTTFKTVKEASDWYHNLPSRL